MTNPQTGSFWMRWSMYYHSQRNISPSGWVCFCLDMVTLAPNTQQRTLISKDTYCINSKRKCTYVLIFFLLTPLTHICQFLVPLFSYPPLLSKQSAYITNLSSAVPSPRRSFQTVLPNQLLLPPKTDTTDTVFPFFFLSAAPSMNYHSSRLILCLRSRCWKHELIFWLNILARRTIVRQNQFRAPFKYLQK